MNNNIHVYNKTVINSSVTNVSYNGGNGGIKAQPSANELRYAGERHIPVSSEQRQHQQLARKNPELKLANNHGKPSIASTSKAGDFSKEHTFAAKSAGAGFKPATLNKGQAGAAGQGLNAKGNSGFRSQTLSHTGTGSNSPANSLRANTNTGNNPPKQGTVRRTGPGPSRPAPRVATPRPVLKAPPPPVTYRK
jgi:hypothetical protein